MNEHKTLREQNEELKRVLANTRDELAAVRAEGTRLRAAAAQVRKVLLTPEAVPEQGDVYAVLTWLAKTWSNALVALESALGNVRCADCGQPLSDHSGDRCAIERAKEEKK